MSHNRSPGTQFIPLNELTDFVRNQFVVLEGESAISEEERKYNSQVIKGMESAYTAGKIAMLLEVSNFVEYKRLEIDNRQ